MIEVDTKNIEKMIENGHQGLKKAERKALLAGAMLIKEKAISNLKTRLPKATQPNPKYSDTLVDAIMMSVKEGAVNTMYFTVHTMGVRKSTSGTFRARFFQQGTVPRRTKKGYNRGQIQPLRFFSDTVATTSNSAVELMKKTFSEEINTMMK